jgi:hypothetical protein
MDQRSVVLDLHLKGLSAHAIHEDLVATLGPKAVAYSTVTHHLREAKLGTAEVTLDPEPCSLHLTSMIPTGLSWQPWKKRKPFASMRELARSTHIPRAIVYRRLTKSLGFVQRLLRWVPQPLSDPQKVRRVELALSLSVLRILEVQEQRV